MVVVFVRHGEKRRGESDPELTSWGRRMSTETGRWLGMQGLRPTAFVTTPSCRTRQTAEELALALESSAPTTTRHLAEDAAGWSLLLSALWQEQGAAAVVVCVGHHPTVDLLRQLYDLPVLVPAANYACAIMVDGQPGAWRCVASWPGRP